MEGIAVHGDDIGIHLRRNAANPGLQTQRFGGDRSCVLDRGHQILAAVAHASDEFFVISAVHAGDGIRAVNDFQILVIESLLESSEDNSRAFLHEREALFVVIADA